MKFTEESLISYAAPLSQTEDQKCKNAIGMVRDALKDIGFTDDNRLIESMVPDTYAFNLEMRSISSDRKVKLFVQGSYANNTNVRLNSDVDIAVVLESTFRPKYRPGLLGKNYGFSDSADNIQQFKNDVQQALIKRFGRDVERKNKSIKVHGNSYRVDADTVPCMRYRDYSDDYSLNPNNYVSAIFIQPDEGEGIINYPEQHIINGRTKNAETHLYFKKMVRIIKRMRYLMQDYQYASASGISSFGLESLLWNIPNSLYLENSQYRLVYMFHCILSYLNVNKELLLLYKEANGIKPLCPTQADFGNYLSFLGDLSIFYEYE